MSPPRAPSHPGPRPLSPSITASQAVCPRPQRFHTRLWNESLTPCRRGKLLAASAGAYPPTSPPGTWHSLAGQCEPRPEGSVGISRCRRRKDVPGRGAARVKAQGPARVTSSAWPGQRVRWGGRAGGTEGRALGPFGRVADAQRGEPGTLGDSCLHRLRDGHHLRPRQVGASGTLKVRGRPPSERGCARGPSWLGSGPE